MNETFLTPTVSVVIVSWNARDFLLRCIESLRPEFASLPGEILVVDNASSDGSPEAVAEAYPDVKVMRLDTNAGFAKANNVGIRAARGRFVFLVNSDVEVKPGCLPSLVACMERDSRVGLAGPRILNADGSVQPSWRKFPSLGSTLCRALALDSLARRWDPMTPWKLQDVDILSGCFWATRREALDDVGLLDEQFFMYAEDMDWCRRFRNKGWRVVCEPAGRAVHYGGASSAQAPIRFHIEMHRANLQYWRKHHTAPAVACFVSLTVLHELLRIVRCSVLWVVCPSRRGEASHKLARSVASLRWFAGAEPDQVSSEARA